jgi:hypothetical protein
LAAAVYRFICAACRTSLPALQKAFRRFMRSVEKPKRFATIVLNHRPQPWLVPHGSMILDESASDEWLLLRIDKLSSSRTEGDYKNQPNAR